MADVQSKIICETPTPGKAPTLAQRSLDMDEERLRFAYRAIYLGLIWILLALQSRFTLLGIQRDSGDGGGPSAALIVTVPLALLVAGALSARPLSRRGLRAWLTGLLLISGAIGGLFGYELEGMAGAVFGPIIGAAIQVPLALLVRLLAGRLPLKILRYLLGAVSFTLLGWLLFLPLLWIGGAVMLSGSPGVGSMVRRKGMGALTILFTLPVWPLLALRATGWFLWLRRALWVLGSILFVACSQLASYVPSPGPQTAVCLYCQTVSEPS